MLCAVCSACVCAVYLELFIDEMEIERASAIPQSLFSFTSLWHMAVFAAAFLAFFWLLWRKNHALLSFLYRRRFIFGAAVVLLLTAFNISGSSLAAWTACTGADPFEGTLFGIARSIRSDEWAVFTPFAFSQAASGYAGVSDILRATATDVTMVYALPAWSLSTLFRPFLWGYLLLGSSHGLAFFWSARLVCLFLVSFEFGRLITNDRKWLALTYTALIVFAPIVQWWFAVNGMAELFIFGQGIVLALDRFLRAHSLRAKILLAPLLAYLCGGYLLILYPAWQVPLFYLFAAAGVWIILRFRKQLRSSDAALARPSFKRDVLPLVGSFVLLAIALATIVANSADTIAAVMNTTYPGHRVETGGGLASYLFTYGISLLTPLNPNMALPNVCEQATFFTLFPLGIVLAIIALVKKRDSLLVLLLAVDGFLFAFGIIGFPVQLASATLLSNVTMGRLKLAIGLADVLLLIRALAVLLDANRERNLLEEKHWMLPAAIAGCLVIAVIFTVVATPETCFPAINAYAPIVCGAVLLLTVGIAFTLLSGQRYLPCLTVAVTVIVLAGCCVNPVQQGTAALTNNEFSSTISAITEADPDGIWLADDSMYGQFCVANGARTINSVNTYPTLQRWSALDPEGLYTDIYNRYAWIEVNPVSDQATSFFCSAGHGADTFAVNLNVDDLKQLGVAYWLSARDLTTYATSSVSFVPIDELQGQTIYHIVYAA